ncbi:gamma-tubulin complex component 4 [Canna indica]|uniref:Gamma-tubulin complex component n=1 Tax=Canna indica TaxID=4628 RepID=A0AAQ3K4B5_9LILI|nr:gamma-tubulin complex component 4 [Canna indica]
MHLHHPKADKKLDRADDRKVNTVPVKNPLSPKLARAAIFLETCTEPVFKISVSSNYDDLLPLCWYLNFQLLADTGICTEIPNCTSLWNLSFGRRFLKAIHWPLQLFFTQDVISKYCKVFQYLIRPKRTQMELERSWAAVMHQDHIDFANNRRDCKNSLVSQHQRRLYTPMWRVREHMIFLIRNLQWHH